MRDPGNEVVLGAFLATFGIPFSYLLKVSYMRDAAGIYISYLNFVPSLNVF